MKLKQKIVRGIFCVEILIFSGWYICGSHGIRAQRAVAHERMQVEIAIQALRAEITQLKTEIAARQTDELYKERVAREQLQMAREGDIVYFIE